MSEHQSGLRKSAIVLLSLGEERAAELLRRLEDDVAGQLRAEMRRVGRIRGVPPEDRQQVLGEFCDAADSFAIDDGQGSERFADDPADDDTDELFDGICDEHPQTIALVLSNLAPNQAGEVLARIEPHRKVEVIKRIAQIERTSAGVIEQVEQGLRQRLRAMMGRRVRSAGVSAVAQILNFADRKIEQEILSDLELESPDLADQIRRVQGIFEDLLEASDEDLRAVLDQLDEMTISMALRTAGQRLLRKVLGVMPVELAMQIEAGINDGRAVAVTEIEAAQQRVAEVVHRLDAAGEIEVLSPPAPQQLGREGNRV